MNRVLILGSFVTDLAATMDRFPEAGESVIGTRFQQFMGGKGANQAVSLARLGAKVTMLGEVGNDAFGDRFIQLLQDEGIDGHILRSQKQATGISSVQINGSGQNRICIILGANLEYTIDDLHKEETAIASNDVFLTQGEMNPEMTDEAILLAKRLGLITVVNPAPCRPIRDEVLSKIDYLTPNETELARLSGQSTETIEQVNIAAQSLLQRGVKNVICTLGERGSLWVNAMRSLFVGAYSVRAVDTVAAGDSFNGAFIKALMEGKNETEILRTANAMGALTTLKHGAIPSLATKAELEEFIRVHPQPDAKYE